MRCVSSIEDDLFATRLAPRSVAAVFVEPIRGEGGYVVPPPGCGGALRELCDRHGILLVCDEVQCGVGRTGEMWACEHEGIEPDVLLAAKGLGSGMPIGAIIAKESIMKWQPGAHGSTFGGNPVCCAAALATLDVVERELLPNVPRLGERLLAGAKRLQEKRSEEHTSELQSRLHLVCRLLLEKKKRASETTAYELSTDSRHGSTAS